MNRYERYRDSGYDWLGQVPIHWEPRPIRSIFALSDERCGDKEFPLLSVYREYGVIEKDSRDDNHNVESSDLSNYKYVGRNYLVMNKMKMWQGSLGVSAFEGIVSPAYIVCTFRDVSVHPLYGNYLLRSHTLKTHYNRISYGIRVGQWDLRYEDLKSLVLYIPPISEQEQIIRFLDKRLALIDKYVKEKGREMELLKELKNAEINRAVTKGLNPDAEMKDSRVEWIGNTPKHWDDLSLSQCVFEQCISNKDVHHQNLLSLSYGQIVRKDINKTDGLLPSSFDTYQVVNKGNIVLRLTDLQNDKKSLRTGIANETGIVTSAYLTLNCYEHINPEYLHYILHCYDLRKVFYGLGGGLRQNCTFREIRKLVIYRPPLSEQHAIVAYIQQMEERINKAIASIEREIELVKEYKTRLVSDVVTGKVDVRDINVPKE